MQITDSLGFKYRKRKREEKTGKLKWGKKIEFNVRFLALVNFLNFQPKYH